jgi:hypothetical protein
MKNLIFVSVLGKKFHNIHSRLLLNHAVVDNHFKFLLTLQILIFRYRFILNGTQNDNSFVFIMYLMCLMYTCIEYRSIYYIFYVYSQFSSFSSYVIY